MEVMVVIKVMVLVVLTVEIMTKEVAAVRVN